MIVWITSCYILHVLTHWILFVIDSLTIINIFPWQYYRGFVLTIPLILAFDPENMRMLGHVLRIIGTFLGIIGEILIIFENNIIGQKNQNNLPNLSQWSLLLIIIITNNKQQITIEGIINNYFALNVVAKHIIIARARYSRLKNWPLVW